LPPSLVQSPTPTVEPSWSVPDIGALPDDDESRLVRLGRDLITATYADGFSEQQHIYGPFEPILEELARLKATSMGRPAP
jgi:hypothetical protein